MATAAFGQDQAVVREEQLTSGKYGHILTNIGVWSPDSRRIVYDVRSDVAGDVFDGTRIETVDVETLKVRVLYESQHKAHCGVATYCPTQNKVVFILGPEDPIPDWSYSACHRRGVLVDESRPRHAVNLDARDITSPFTRGALRGGTHVHVFSPDGQWVSFTYEDHVLAPNQRNIGVSVSGHVVKVKKDHPRNHDGAYFTVLVTRTTVNPKPGSDDIKRAYEEA